MKITENAITNTFLSSQADGPYYAPLLQDYQNSLEDVRTYTCLNINQTCSYEYVIYVCRPEEATRVVQMRALTNHLPVMKLLCMPSSKN